MSATAERWISRPGPSAVSLGRRPLWHHNQRRAESSRGMRRPCRRHTPPATTSRREAPPGGRASPLSMLREQGSSSQSTLSWQLDWAFQVLAKPAPVASTSPPAVLKSSPSRPLKFPQRPEGPGQGWEGSGVGRGQPERSLCGRSREGPLTLHAPLGGLVQRQEELHHGRQLHLQPEAEGRVHEEVVGGWLEDGEARCKAGVVRGVGARGGCSPPPHPHWRPKQDSPVTWGRLTCSSFSRTLPSDLKSTTCRQGRGDAGTEKGRGAGRREGRGQGTHVLLVVGQQHHCLQAGLLVCGAAGGQLTQDGVGVVVGALGEAEGVAAVAAGGAGGRTRPGCLPTLVST